jgi:hypothetical protein
MFGYVSFLIAFTGFFFLLIDFTIIFNELVKDVTNAALLLDSVSFVLFKILFFNSITSQIRREME